jgi:hypothetical protein
LRNLAIRVKKTLKNYQVKVLYLKKVVYICTHKRENSSAGRASAFQAECREFESRFPLFEILDSKIKFCLGGGIGRHAGLKILCPLGRAGSSPA